MSNPQFPNHTLPKYSTEACENGLFHYTTANGLLGILQRNCLWSSAYYCANDGSELNAVRNFLTPVFREMSHKMIEADDPRVQTFSRRGVPIWEYSDKFEDMIISFALNFFSVFITCFCKANTKEDFTHGLLSQWRGYGTDGGYAIQFNRSKLQAVIDQGNKQGRWEYDMQDVAYSAENRFKTVLFEHTEAFKSAYLKHLDYLANHAFDDTPMPSPLANLVHGPLESLLDFLIYTKNAHFREENECRIGVVSPTKPNLQELPVDYFNRKGLIVPFLATPEAFDIVKCIDWIIVGPGPRLTNRFISVNHVVRNLGLKIDVRPSHIPFLRE